MYQRHYLCHWEREDHRKCDVGVKTAMEFRGQLLGHLNSLHPECWETSSHEVLAHFLCSKDILVHTVQKLLSHSCSPPHVKLRRGRLVGRPWPPTLQLYSGPQLGPLPLLLCTLHFSTLNCHLGLPGGVSSALLLRRLYHSQSPILSSGLLHCLLTVPMARGDMCTTQVHVFSFLPVG